MNKNEMIEFKKFIDEIVQPHEQYEEAKDFLKKKTKGLDKEQIRHRVFEAAYMSGFTAGMSFALSDEEQND